MKASIHTELLRFAGAPEPERRSDELAAEEPLEIRVNGAPLAVVMRTPGHDAELTAGFLLSEGMLQHRKQLRGQIQESGGSTNSVDISLAEEEGFDLAKFTRHIFTSSSCGICGRASIEAVRQAFPPIQDTSSVAASMLMRLPDKLLIAQAAFQKTGGLHASGLFDLAGELLETREDIGRHNAVDKLIGHALLHDHLPLKGTILLLSGRASFELLQKALAAGIPIIASIGAPSSLAVEFARENSQTLVGFLRSGSMNVYAGASRIKPETC